MNLTTAEGGHPVKTVSDETAADIGKTWDRVWVGAQLATMAAGAAPYGIIRDAGIAVRGERIAWIGRAEDAARAAAAHSIPSHDVCGAWITPGLIDCHTHLVYGGNRVAEYESRLSGVSYEEIAKAGGGIQSTVRATRAASVDELRESARIRAQALMAEGVTTIEIKSGYGLATRDGAATARGCSIARANCRSRSATTYLGLHALPEEFRSDRRAFVDSVERSVARGAERRRPRRRGRCVLRDPSRSAPTRPSGFCAPRRRWDCRFTCMPGQLSDMGAAQLAAKFAALSADHLEYLSAAGADALAESGTVAVLLPGAYYTLRQTTPPPVALLRAAGVPIAVATDCNPGTSPCTSLLLSMNMACTLFGLTPAEALLGATAHAARALGLLDDRGTLEVGKRADFVLVAHRSARGTLLRPRRESLASASSKRQGDPRDGLSRCERASRGACGCMQARDPARSRSAICRRLTAAHPRFAAGWVAASQIALRTRLHSPRQRLASRQCRRSAVQILALHRREEALCGAAARPAAWGAIGTMRSFANDQARRTRGLRSRLGARPARIRICCINRASVRRFLGDLAGAEADYDRVIALKPADYEAYVNRSELRAQTPARNHVAELESLAAPSRIGAARFKFDSRSPRNMKTSASSRSHSRSCGSVPGGGASIFSMTWRPMSRPSSGSSRLFPAGPPHPTPNACVESPIFIVGLPRSGTTLVERILGSHSAITPAGELDCFALALVDAARARSGGAQACRGANSWRPRRAWILRRSARLSAPCARGLRR
jgi:imidazolonepropionase